jgi:hypothetical protein
LIVANQAGAPSSWYFVRTRSGSMAATFHPLPGLNAALSSSWLSGAAREMFLLRRRFGSSNLRKKDVRHGVFVTSAKDAAQAVLSATARFHDPCHAAAWAEDRG